MNVEKGIFLGRAALNIAARCSLRATRRGCEPIDHDKGEKARPIEAIEPQCSMSKAYQVVFECPKGGHKVSLQRKSPKTSLSEVEAKKMFEGEEISCGHCGWHGKVSKMRLRQIVPFNWIYSPAT